MMTQRRSTMTRSQTRFCLAYCFCTLCCFTPLIQVPPPSCAIARSVVVVLDGDRNVGFCIAQPVSHGHGDVLCSAFISRGGLFTADRHLAVGVLIAIGRAPVMGGALPAVGGLTASGGVCVCVYLCIYTLLCSLANHHMVHHYRVTCPYLLCTA